MASSTRSASPTFSPPKINLRPPQDRRSVIKQSRSVTPPRQEPSQTPQRYIFMTTCTAMEKITQCPANFLEKMQAIDPSLTFTSTALPTSKEFKIFVDINMAQNLLDALSAMNITTKLVGPVVKLAVRNLPRTWTDDKLLEKFQEHFPSKDVLKVTTVQPKQQMDSAQNYGRGRVEILARTFYENPTRLNTTLEKDGLFRFHIPGLTPIYVRTLKADREYFQSRFPQNSKRKQYHQGYQSKQKNRSQVYIRSHQNSHQWNQTPQHQNSHNLRKRRRSPLQMQILIPPGLRSTRRRCMPILSRRESYRGKARCNARKL